MISYTIRTNYSKIRELQETIKSILNQKGEKEIIVCGIMPETDIYFDKVRFIDLKEYADQGYTSKMRDRGFVEAKGEYIVSMDDDLLLHDDFQDNIGKEDIQIPACENIRGGRFWDWAVIHPKLGHFKVPYDTPYSEYNYLSGQCFIMKSEVAKNNLHDTDLKFHQNDDVDYGKKLQKAGYVFTMNIKTRCIHNDPRYIETTNKLGVLKFV